MESDLPSGVINHDSGVINLDKPAGISSAAAVARVKRLLPRGVKIGHAGTLDPFATGVLLLLVGKATKLCERLMSEPKQYEAVITLGATTETLDPESPEITTPDARDPGRSEIERALATFIGEIQQVPPAYSALKIAGRPAYDRVRAGQTVNLEARTVRVYGISLLDYHWPAAHVRIDCGRGTYIRSIARDVGNALAVGGYLRQLRRTRVGPFRIEQSVTLDRLHKEGTSPHLEQPGL
jgi:tRNA pseudouridine55 synthase